MLAKNAVSWDLYHPRLGLSRFEAQEPVFIITSIPDDSYARSPRTPF